MQSCPLQYSTWCRCFQHRGHILVVDNYYTSVELFKYLEEHGTAAIGTLRRDRVDLPARLRVKVKGAKKTSFVAKKGGPKIWWINDERTLMCMAWYDKNPFAMLSSFGGSATVRAYRIVKTKRQRTVKALKNARPGSGRDKPRKEYYIEYDKKIIHKPQAALFYNRYMGGVDRSDQVCLFIHLFTRDAIAQI